MSFLFRSLWYDECNLNFVVEVLASSYWSRVFLWSFASSKKRRRKKRVSSCTTTFVMKINASYKTALPAVDCAQFFLLLLLLSKTRSIFHNCHLLCEVSPPYSFLVQVWKPQVHLSSNKTKILMLLTDMIYYSP